MSAITDKATLLALRRAREIADDDKTGVSRTSPHAGGRLRPTGWHQRLRAARKARKAAHKPRKRKRKKKKGR